MLDGDRGHNLWLLRATYRDLEMMILASTAMQPSWYGRTGLKRSEERCLVTVGVDLVVSTIQSGQDMAVDAVAGQPNRQPEVDQNTKTHCTLTP